MLSEQELLKNKSLEKKFLKTETFMAKNGYMMEHDVYALCLKEPQTDSYGNVIAAGSVISTTCGPATYCGKLNKGPNRKQRRKNNAT